MTSTMGGGIGPSPDRVSNWNRRTPCDTLSIDASISTSTPLFISRARNHDSHQAQTVNVRKRTRLLECADPTKAQLPMPNGLELLVEVATALQADTDTPSMDRRQRDRTIGRSLEGNVPPTRQLAHWLAHPESPASGNADRTVVRIQRTATMILGLVGLLAGWAASAAVFHYDGKDPVNVIGVLAVFVVAQLLLVLLTLLTMLPQPWLRHLPGARSVQDLLAFLSPGRIRNGLMRRIPFPFRNSATSVVGRSAAYTRLFSAVNKWAVSLTAQWGALMFQIGALLGCLYLIVFSDLAFSWNTTLQVEPNQLHQITSRLAGPWAAWIQDANPSLSLIEATRHFRLRDGIFPGMEPLGRAHPAALGGWWPFLVASMVSYGLFPRMMTLLIANWRFRAATQSAVLHYPGTQELLDCLNTQLVETSAECPETEANGIRSVGTSKHSGTMNWPPESGIHVVNWARLDLDDSGAQAWCQRQWGGRMISIRHAGGARSLEEDQAVIAALVTTPMSDPIVIMARAWEPPIAEFLDFIQDLRTAVGPERRIAVVPLHPTANRQSSPPTPGEQSLWRRQLAGLGDPWLTVHDSMSEDPS